MHGVNPAAAVGHVENYRSTQLRLPGMGTMPTTTNDFDGVMNWTARKLPVGNTRYRCTAVNCAEPASVSNAVWTPPID